MRHSLGVNPPEDIRAASSFACWGVICSFALMLFLRAKAGVLIIDLFEKFGFGYRVIMVLWLWIDHGIFVESYLSEG